MNHNELLNDELIPRASTEDYISRLETIINEANDLHELVLNLDAFLEKANLPTKMVSDIIKIRNGFNENVNAVMARNQLSRYFEKCRNEIKENDGTRETINNNEMATLNYEDRNIYKNDNPMNITLNDDGTITINGDSNNPSSVNYAAMLTLMLVTNDPEMSLKTNFDMLFSKRKEDDSTFSITFGDFPIEKHQDRKVDNALLDEIKNRAVVYDKGNNYIDNLAVTAPELREVFALINDSILNRTGFFKLAVRNNGNTHDLAFGLDENYVDITLAFAEAGVAVREINSYNTIHLEDNNSERQHEILVEVNKSLKSKMIEKGGIQKVLELEEVASVDAKFLQVLLVANVLMLVVLIALILLTILK